MLESTAAEVEAAFASADNLNAALKTFLKREGKAGKSVETFAKSFRSVVSGGRADGVRSYIEANYPARKVHFALLVSYAHPTLRDTVVPSVIEKHADAFNATCEKTDSGVKVTDEKAFGTIVKDVVSMVGDGLEKAGLPRNNFFVYSLLITIFEADVLEQVLPVLGA